jgi:hypothetical protein
MPLEAAAAVRQAVDFCYPSDAEAGHATSAAVTIHHRPTRRPTCPLSDRAHRTGGHPAGPSP